VWKRVELIGLLRWFRGADFYLLDSDPAFPKNISGIQGKNLLSFSRPLPPYSARFRWRGGQ